MRLIYANMRQYACLPPFCSPCVCSETNKFDNLGMFGHVYRLEQSSIEQKGSYGVVYPLNSRDVALRVSGMLLDT